MKKLFSILGLLLATQSFGAVSERDLAQIATPYNYLTNGGCESSTTGFNKFNTTFSGGIPTTITFGSNKLSLSSVTTNILQGNASCQMNVTTASGSTGHGIITDPITIKDSDLGRVLAAAFSYNFVAGNANVDVSGTSTQTVQVWVYNIGLGTWYQPAGYNSINTNGGSGQLVPGQTPDITFQSNISNSSNNNQYRVALIIANDPTGTFQLNFDNMSFGPTKKAYGPAITNWASFNPTGTLNTNTLYTGQWRRVGDSMEIAVDMIFTGAPNSVGTITIDVPFGLNIDPNKLSVTNGGSQAVNVGRNVITGNSGIVISGSVLYLGPTNVEILSNFLSGSLVEDGGTTPTFPVTLSSGNTLHATAKFPIVGWSSNSTLSQDTDTRIVAFSAGMAGSPTIAPPNGILWDTIFYDTHGAYDPATSFYHVPVSGYYRIFLSEADSTTTNNGLILVNGGAVAQGQQHVLAGEPGLTAITYKLNAGDVVYATISNNGTLTNGVTLNFMTIERVSGPSVIAASETDAASYGQAFAQSIPASTRTQLTTWSVKNIDTHNAFDPVGGTYIIPVSGTYRIYFQSQFSTVGNAQFFTQIYRTVGGTPTQLGYGLKNNPNSQDTIPTSVLFPLNAGDQITFDVTQGTGSSQTINADSLGVFFNLERIGN